MIKFRCYFLVSGGVSQESSFIELKAAVAGKVNRPKRIVDSAVGYGDWRFMSNSVESVDELPHEQIEQLLEKLCEAKSTFSKLPVRVLQLQITVAGIANQFNGVCFEPKLLKMVGELDAIIDVSVAFRDDAKTCIAGNE